MQRRATKDIGVHGSAFHLHRIRHGLASNSGLVRRGWTWDGVGVKRGRNALIAGGSISRTRTTGRGPTTTHCPVRRATTGITRARTSTTGRVLALAGIHAATPQRGAARESYKTILECSKRSIKAMGGTALLIGAGTTGPRAGTTGGTVEQGNHLQSTKSTMGRALKAS